VSGAAHPAVEAARQAGVRVGLILPLDDASSDGNTTVALDNRSAMHQAAELLWNLGHRRVAYAMTSLSTTNGWDRRIWLGAALEGHGVELTDDLVYVDPVIGGLDETDEIECGRRAAMVLLGRPNRPTAVCAGNDLIAIGLVRGARDLGLVVPKDISIVGFDDLAMASIVEPPLTTLAVPRYELGRAVVDRLVDESSAARPRVVVRPILVVRASTAEAPALPQPTFLRQP
jgi:LacI family transcriptional regulator